MKKTLLSIILTGFFYCYTNAQTTVTLNPDKDNSIYSESSNSNGLGELFSGQTCNNDSRRALMHFDITSSLPSGAIVTGASLNLNVSLSGSAAGNQNFTLHALTKDFGEGTSNGTGTGGVAVAPDANWTDAMLGTSFWTNAGGDFGPPSATTGLTSANGIYSWASTAMVTDVQNWLNNPATNFGWILIGDENTICTARKFGSKDGGITPVLSITYNCPATISTDSVSACISYTWIDGNTYTSSNNTATVTLVNSVGCDSIITLNLSLTTVDVSTSVTSFTITSNATGATYQWLDCDNGNAIIPGETAQSFTALANGNYAVQVTQNACVDTSACVAIIGIGITESTLNNLLVFPNPSNGQFEIDLGAEHKNVSITIKNVLGQSVFSKNFNRLQSTNINSIADSGIYFIEISKNNNQRNFVKLIKQ